ncbi:hypothetical protein ACHAWF_012960 [Thalassiosira exigua]
MVYYPDPTKPRAVQGDFPVVLFHRGSSGWQASPDGYDKWLKSMAQQCLIVIAPMTGPETSDLCKRDRDLATAYTFAKLNWSRWKIDATPNINVVGAGGHSAGAHHLPRFQMDFGFKLSAAMYSHGGGRRDLGECLAKPNSKCEGVPAFFLTTLLDGIDELNPVSPEGTLDWYEKLAPTTDHAIFAKLGDGKHMEPLETGRLNDYTARFFACHLYKDGHSGEHSDRKREACSWLYGTHPHICSRVYQLPYGYFGDCRVKQPNNANIAVSESG